MAALVAILLLAGCGGNRETSPPPAPANVPFTGSTRADALLRSDVLRYVAAIAEGRYDCRSIETVAAGPAPSGYVPFMPPPENTIRIASEKWIVTHCGESLPYVVTFFFSQSEGTIFALSEYRGN